MNLGAYYSILVSGSIGPDSASDIGQGADERMPCTGVSGEVIARIRAVQESGGGLLDNGHKLGDSFRAKGFRIEHVLEDILNG